MSGQASLEYLLIITVILLVVLVVVLVLGEFTGVGVDAKIKKSKVYWQSSYPISVEEVAIQNSTAP
jgi:uncharacterized protein (UPF0333 family)